MGQLHCFLTLPYLLFFAADLTLATDLTRLCVQQSRLVSSHLISSHLISSHLITQRTWYALQA